MKRSILLLSGLALLALTGCSKKFAVSASGENLVAISQITDSDETSCHPYGGENGKNLYFSGTEKNDRYANIYKKDNVTSASISPKTSGNNKNFNPCYNAATDRVAFSYCGENSSSWDIYIAPATQGNMLMPVTETSDMNESNPSFSTDGTLLLYDKHTGLYQSAKSEIWMKNLKTGESTLICNGYCPSFSPDNEWVVFVRYESVLAKGRLRGIVRGNSSIWMMKRDGTNQVQLTDAKKGSATSPRFSPDGKEIIFQLVRKDKKDADLYVIDIKGGNLRQLTTNKSFDGQPYWSKDNYIYFTSDRGNKMGRFQIWRFRMPH